MVFVVERYLPGLSRSDLLSGLAKLERLRGAKVRYLGSTIVLADDACYCRFEGPTEVAVAEANRRAGLAFDRILPVLTVQPKGMLMSVAGTHPTTVQIGRGRLLGLIVAAAVLAAAATWAVSALVGGSSHASASTLAPSTATPQHSTSIMSLTPAELAANALGSGYAGPTASSGPTVESILAAMSPPTRAYTNKVIALTFRQLSTGAAGSP
jgi:Protein of unknown function (DUF4242)